MGQARVRGVPNDAVDHGALRVDALSLDKPPPAEWVPPSSGSTVESWPKSARFPPCVSYGD